MEPLLQVKDLRVRFRSDFGDRVVTDDISFRVDPGETLGIVGESGCGKSVTSLAVMGLLARNGSVERGEVLFRGRDLLKLSPKELDRVRGKEIAMVFQDALASLNPVFTVGNQLTEAILAHGETDRRAARERARTMLEKAGLPDAAAVMRKYPSQLSGGMRQRAMIAMALSCSPSLLIADEPTTALDVTIQAQIMDSIRALRRELGMAMILITHDIGLVAQMADRVLVMYAGQIVEEADVFKLFAHPAHPYTRALLDSVPGVDDGQERILSAIGGTVPEDYSAISGCRFRDRCPYAGRGCDKPQKMEPVGPGHRARCCRTGWAEGGEI